MQFIFVALMAVEPVQLILGLYTMPSTEARTAATARWMTMRGVPYKWRTVCHHGVRANRERDEDIYKGAGPSLFPGST